MPMFGPGLSVGLMLCPAYAPVPAAAAAAADADASMDMAGTDMAGMDMAGMDMSTAMSMAAPAAQPDAHRPAHDGSARTDHQEHTLCPYAASATLAAPPHLFDVSTPAHEWTQVTVLAAAQVGEFQLLPRAQMARAPPLPS